jgi:hypothetical protein
MVVKAKYGENMCRCANFRCADVEIVTLGRCADFKLQMCR